jgi:hypothetical protein
VNEGSASVRIGGVRTQTKPGPFLDPIAGTSHSDQEMIEQPYNRNQLQASNRDRLGEILFDSDSGSSVTLLVPSRAMEIRHPPFGIAGDNPEAKSFALMSRGRAKLPEQSVVRP